MSEKVKVELGDFTFPAGSEPVAGAEIVALLATKYGVPVQSLVDEITGNSILAKIARDLLSLERTPKKMGAPKDEYEAWRVYDRVERGRLMGRSVADTIRDLVEEAGGENAKVSRSSTFTRRYNRERKARGKISLQGLFQTVSLKKKD